MIFGDIDPFSLAFMLCCFLHSSFWIWENELAKVSMYSTVVLLLLLPPLLLPITVVVFCNTLRCMCMHACLAYVCILVCIDSYVRRPSRIFDTNLSTNVKNFTTKILKWYLNRASLSHHHTDFWKSWVHTIKSIFAFLQISSSDR